MTMIGSRVNSKYHDIKSLNSLDVDTPSSFGVFHVNIASLDRHIDDLKELIAECKHKFNVIGISEHKIKIDKDKNIKLPSNNIDITGYDPFIFEPTETTHGGTGFYIKQNTDYVERPDLKFVSPSDHESMFIEIIFPNRKNLIVGCIYRHPSSKISVTDFAEKFMDPVLDKVGLENKDFIMMGDFNVNLLKIDTNDECSEFFNSMTTHHLTPYILQPTRLQAKTLIDNIYFNSLEYTSNSGNLLVELSDHLSQFLILEGYVKERKIPEINLFKRDTKNFNEREFHEEVIAKINWALICQLAKKDPHMACKRFYDTINYQLDEYAPLRKITRKEYELMSKPWINNEILSKCKERNQLLKNISKCDDPLLKVELRNEYKQLRNDITAAKRISKKEYYSAFFERNKYKSSEVWKGIRALVNLKTSKSSNFKLLGQDNTLISDPTKISNIFNNHFSSIGASIDRKIPQVPGNYKDYFYKRDKNGQLLHKTPVAFFLEPAAPKEIEKIIDGINSKKSVGPFSLPVSILKTFKEFFAFWLCELINLAFEVGEFPDILKIAKLSPLHKKESKLDHINYRPISLLSVISKIYEKAIYTRMYTFLENNKLIYKKQFGFRRAYSVNHALISITERIRNLLDNQNYVCGIFIDLEKAFDTVNHEILCDKLNFYGMHGNINKLIKSYLTNRKQYVSINGFDSEIRDVTCGVPQGSSLGPLLFLVYINDFWYCLNDTESGHFADDTFILFHGKNPKTIETVINTELKLCLKWLRLNRLSLNAGKTELIFFRSRRHALDYDKISIKFDGVKLHPVDFVKYLGMFLDKFLSWDYHIRQLSNKLSRANGIISKLRYNAPLEVCLELYYAIFYSHMIYGCNLWGLTPRDENIDKIEKLQKKCVRIMTFSEYKAHTTPLFSSLKIVKVRDVIQMQHLKLVFEYKQNTLPDDLMSLFEVDTNIHSYSTSSASKDLLHIPEIHTLTYGNKSIRYHCPYTWNHTFKKVVPINNKNGVIRVDEIRSLPQFKSLMKKHYLHTYCDNDV